MTIDSLEIGDVVTDGYGNYAVVTKDTDSPYKKYYANIDDPDDPDKAILVTDFDEDHLCD
jgi:hypothetical protein